MASPRRSALRAVACSSITCRGETSLVVSDHSAIGGRNFHAPPSTLSLWRSSTPQIFPHLHCCEASTVIHGSSR